MCDNGTDGSNLQVTFTEAKGLVVQLNHLMYMAAHKYIVLTNPKWFASMLRTGNGMLRSLSNHRTLWSTAAW